MSSTLESIEKSTATIKIEVSPEEYSQAVRKAYDKNRKRFSVPGFRKGKVPKQVIESHYGKGVFMEDAIDIVFPPAFTKAIEELELNPVTRPDLEQIEKISEEEGATFIVKVGVKPEIVLGDYKGAEIDSLEPVIDDKKIMAELQKMQDQNSRLITLEEGEVKDGSTATIDYEGFLGDEPFVGGKDSDYDLKIGSQTFIPGFEEQLIGAKIGESLDVNVTFPEDYHAENLKGQDVVFKVAIKGIKEKELPELDDEFAKDISEFDTLEEYKADLSKKLFDSEKEELKGKAQSDAVEFALNAAEFDVPYLMIEEEVDQTMQNFENQMSQQGLTLDDYFKYTNTNREDFRNNLKGDAEKNIRIELVLATIGEVENIAVSEEEIDEEIKVFAEAYGKDFEEYKNSIQDRMKEYIEANVKRRKTVDLLVDAAVVKA
ncbi:MAG: trigger factor [Eubacteriaceae bacterium]|jgi:trigger factor|nr:trigger factor [Eubacteriaceae bacterium]MDK2905089.1 trigger factor [Eubacteriaceae bacterium]MDK2935813.1 trigger factor [Eubacteriaceae bacterium]